MKNYSVALVDDDQLITDLLSEYFTNLAEHISIVFKANSGSEAIQNINNNLVPEILLLDLKMKEMDGLEVIKILRENHPEIKIVVMSSHYQSSFLGFMLKTGVAGFLPKDIAPRDLIKILDCVHYKGYYLHEDQVNMIRSQISNKVPVLELENENSLSDREVAVLKLLCQQKTAKEIGEQLFVTQKTVEAHKNSLFAKTGVKNLAGLVIFAIQKGYVDVNELTLI